MYCPQCAAQNPDQTKFCRGCGSNLEAVALALSGASRTAESGAGLEARGAQGWLKKRKEGMDAVFKGAALMASSALIGAALGLFSNAKDWIIIWAGMAGWMACWGVFSVLYGVRDIMDSRFMLKRAGAAPPADADTKPLADGGRELPAGEQAALPAPPSVTEYTTEPLAERGAAPKRAGR